MFQKRTGPIAAITASLCLTLVSTSSYAEASSSTFNQAERVQVEAPDSTTLSQVKAMSLADIRFETKSKLSDARQWVKDQKIEQNFDYMMADVETVRDRVQEKAAPVRNALISFTRNKLPGHDLVAAGDRAVSVYGILLILAFGIVVFLMSAASPASRLGGRH